ncbi:MAG: hypothetical protein AAFQ67_07510, partial [Pseudomonadota bacterium]
GETPSREALARPDLKLLRPHRLAGPLAPARSHGSPRPAATRTVRTGLLNDEAGALWDERGQGGIRSAADGGFGAVWTVPSSRPGGGL